MNAVPFKKKNNVTVAGIKRKKYVPQTMGTLEQEIWTSLNYLQAYDFTEAFTYKIYINR